MGKQDTRPRPLGVMNALLAFALSAIMGLGFLLVVNKTHNLLSRNALGVVPNVASLNR